MKCKNCGRENPRKARYCGYCQSELPEKSGKGKVLACILTGFGLIVVLILALIGIFSDPAIKNLEKEIDSIGAVTVNSEEDLFRIGEVFDSLSAKEQNKIRNKDVLIAAVEEYARQMGLIADAMNAINDLDEITLNSKEELAAARNKYDLAKIYDLNGLMKEHEAVLKAAEAELEVLLKEQEQGLEYALSDIDDIVSKFFSGEYNWAKSSFMVKVGKLQKDSDRKQYADTFLTLIREQAQELYDDGSYVAAVTALLHYDDFTDWASEKTVAEIKKLKDSYVSEFNSKAPKNGEVLEQTYSKGTNKFTITAGPADTCVKIQSVNDPEKYAIMYIRANEKATLYNIKSDEYKVMYTTGPVWYGEEEMFGADATFVLYPNTINPQATPTGNGRRWTTYTATLTVGYGNQYGTQNMDPDDF